MFFLFSQVKHSPFTTQLSLIVIAYLAVGIMGWYKRRWYPRRVAWLRPSVPCTRPHPNDHTHNVQDIFTPSLGYLFYVTFRVATVV